MEGTMVMSERTAERLIREKYRQMRRRMAETTGINLNTPYPFLAPAGGGLAGGIAGYTLGRRYNIPDYLSVPAGILTGGVAGSSINNMFKYPEDKISSLRMRIYLRRRLGTFR